MRLIRQKYLWRAFAIAAIFLPVLASASPAPYVKPESLWPFHAFEVLMMVLGFFAAYRAIRAHLPSGDKPARDTPESRPESPPPVADTREMATNQMRANKEKMNQLLNALRVAGLIFMVGGSALACNTGGVDYGPAHLDEFTARIFGGAFFVVGLSDFFLLPRILGRYNQK